VKEIKTFSRQKIRKFVDSKYTMEEMLKVLRRERRWYRSETWNVNF
jgi:hypothetical protein